MSVESLPEPLPEAWMRGPLPGIEPLVQPVFFSFTMVREDLARHTRDYRRNNCGAPIVMLPASGFICAISPAASIVSPRT